MTPARRRLIIIAILIVAGILAFPLRDAIYDAVVIPVAFIAWNLSLMYRSVSQGILWWILIFVVIFILAFSLVPRPSPRELTRLKSKPRHGQIEGLGIWLHRAESGIYFKWLVANRLGKLAYQILLHRESGRPRSVFAPLLGSDWEPAEELQKYLETGLHGSFADFPNTKRRLAAPRHTPLDFDVAQAVDFLESQVENGRSGRRSP